MPSFGKSSLERLDLAAPCLQAWLNRAIEYWDFSIIETYRGEERQNQAFEDGKSHLKYPYSNHNIKPSMAVDIAPWQGRVIWGDTPKERGDVIYFCGLMMGLAKSMYLSGEIKYRIRWGGDWNNNNQPSDERFEDLFHFELIGAK